MSRKMLSLCAALCAFVLLGLPGAARGALNIALEASPDPVEPGGVVHVLVTITNPGGSASGAVTVQMMYPAQLAFISEDLISDGGGCTGTTCDPGELLSWSLGSLPPGGGITVSLTPAVSASAGAMFTLSAEAFEGGVSRGTASQTMTVLAERVLDLAVQEERDPAAAGAALTYALTYGNRSSMTTTSTELRFPLPAGVTFTGATGGGVLQGGEVVWNLGTLPSHEGGRREVTVQVQGVGEGTLLVVNRASLTGDGDFETHQTRTRAVTRVENGTPLGLAVSVNPDPAQPGEPLRVMLTVTNRGASFLNGVTLQLRYPDDLDFVSESVITDGGGCTGTTCDANEILTWLLGTLPPGRGLTVSLPPDLPVLAGGTVVPFTAEVFTNTGASAVASHAVIARPERVLTLTVDEERDPVAAGETLAYVLTASNPSSTTTTNTELRFPLPAGTSFVSATGGGTLSGGDVVWSLGTLSGHESARREVTLQVGGGLAEGTLLEVTTASLSGDGDFLPHQGRARAVTRVENATPLQLSVSAKPDPARPGERLLTEVMVSNRSAVDFLNNVVLELRYPAGLVFVSESQITDGGGCIGTTCDPTEIATWNLGTLPPGEGTAVAFPPVAAATAGGTQVVLDVEALEDSGTSALASQSLVTRVERPLTLAVDEDRDPAATGSVVNYVLTYGNRGATAITNTQLRFPVPAGTTLLSAGSGTVAGNAVVWNLGTLGGHDGGFRVVSVLVNGAEGTLLEVDAASLSGTGGGLARQGRATAVTRVENARPLRLDLTATPDPALPGATLNVGLTARNDSAASLFDVTLQLFYPEGLDFIPEGDVSDGGFCIGTTCDPGEIVTWNLGTLAPGAAVTVSLPPPVDTGDPPPQGAHIRFWAHAFSASGGKAVATRALSINDTLDPDPGPGPAIFADGFESGDTSAWSGVVP